MRKVLIVLGVLVLIVGGFLIYVALQPGDFRIERSATIKAPADVVFAQVNDFHNWEAWSPWAKLDPNAKNSFAGPTSGKDAEFSWSGNDEVGEGRMKIIESDPNKLISIKLDFVRPFEASHTTEFKFKDEGDQTNVTWSMSGTNDFMGRLVCTFMNMDEMLGKEFNKGLAQMKAIAESAAEKK